MKWKKSPGLRQTGPRREGRVSGDGLLVRGPLSGFIAVALVVAAGFLSQGLLFKESYRQASPERMTEDRLRVFVEEHSWLDYTTEGGETIAGLSRDLRLGDPDRIRQDNPSLAETGDTDALDAGLKLRVRYNQLEVDSFLEQGEESADE